MSTNALGEFEEMVLLAMLQLGDGAYGVPIVEEIERRTGRSVARAAVLRDASSAGVEGPDRVVDAMADGGAPR